MNWVKKGDELVKEGKAPADPVSHVSQIYNQSDHVYRRRKIYFNLHTSDFDSFLDGSTHLYMRVCPSVRWSVGWLIGRMVDPSDGP